MSRAEGTGTVGTAQAMLHVLTGPQDTGTYSTESGQEGHELIGRLQADEARDDPTGSKAHSHASWMAPAAPLDKPLSSHPCHRQEACMGAGHQPTGRTCSAARAPGP